MPIKLANKCDIPEGKSVVVLGPNGQEIALFKIKGAIWALDNACPHEGGPLGEGTIERDCVICPWHAWTFNIPTGECLNMPGEDAKRIPLLIIEDEIFLA